MLQPVLGGGVQGAVGRGGQVDGGQLGTVRPTLPAVAAGAQQRAGGSDPVQGAVAGDGEDVEVLFPGERDRFPRCLLYTSDAADE